MKLKEEAEKQYRDNASRELAKKASNAEGGRKENDADSTWGKIAYLNANDIAKLSNDHLKRHLAARNESIEGSKKKLIERLSNSIEDEKQREVRIALEKEHCRIRDIEQTGSVYIAGKNDQGQLGLGLGDYDDRHEFTVIPALRGKQVGHVSAYGSVSIATTLTSEVYSWGGNGVNPIVIGNADSFASPQQMKELDGEETEMTSVGSTHACSISQAGDLFVWGKLGSDDTRLVPQYVDKFTATSVACGAKHIAVITDKGELYMWGGVGSIEQSYQAKPMLVKMPEPIKLIACGSQHTIAATESRVFSWGCGDGYRLGHGNDCSEKSSPCEIATITELGGSQILDVGAGTWHSACVISNESSANESGFLYTWGSGYCGQLSLGKQSIATTPTKVKELSEVKEIICGRTHNAAIVHDDVLYTWGSNEHGQLGRSIEETDVTFTPHPGIVEFGTIVNRIGRGTPKSVVCGHDFTVVATQPYEGPSEQEMIKLLESKRRKEQEEKEEVARLLRVQEEEQTRQRAADAEKKKIRYLTSKRLCTMDSSCPGFTYESSTPSVCRECGFSVAFHTIVADEQNGTDGGIK
eukprot:scaffold7443_cov82-Skeletonema_dohrnii-CCMP3373.AAC.4